MRSAWLVSALLELAGAGVIGTTLYATRRTLPRLARQAPAYPVLPFVAIAAASFALAFILNAVATLDAFVRQTPYLNPLWDLSIIALMLYGVAIPIAMVFSVRNLPLFLRLAMPPRAELRVMAGVYAAGLALRVAPFLLAVFQTGFPFPDQLYALGALLQSAVILIFVWQLDLLRRKPPWIVDRAPNPRPDLDYLKPTRPHYPDAGEYGRFELLIYSAYAWLTFVALLELTRGAGILLGFDLNLPVDVERHALALGFVTLLIFGIAARMVPGFSGKRGIAHPRLVTATFFFGNLAALFRVIPLLLNDAGIPPLFVAPSGALGWLAVACLAWNLTATFRRPISPTPFLTGKEDR